MKIVYLVVAILGAVIPYFGFIDFLIVESGSVIAFGYALFANGAVAGFTVDLVISSVAFWLFMWRQYRLESGPSPLVFVLLNMTIGLSCALPAYLYTCEKQNSAVGRPTPAG